MRGIDRGIELTPERPVGDLATLAAQAEDAGFDAAFVSCHWFNRDPFVAADRIAGATESVRVGPGVANPYETHPAVLASRVATLHEASGGRGLFGIGAGDRSALAGLGIDRERPLRRVLEAMQVARRLWAGERVDHDGTFVARDADLKFDASGPIPAYVGAQGPQMLRMAGKHADGVLVNASHPRDVAWAADQLERGLDDRVRETAFDALAYASVSVDEDPEAAREAARPPVAFIAAGAPSRLLERHGIEPDAAEQVGAYLDTGQFRRAYAAVTDPMLDAFCVAGAPPAVAARLRDILEHVDGIVAGSPLGPTPRASVSLLARAFDRATRG